MAQQTRPTQAPTHTCAADEALDLSCAWDLATHGASHEGLRAYVEKELPHLLRVYDAEFLVNAVESARARPQATR
jgi:hypothetical protein